MLTSFARTRTAPREVNPTFRTAPPGLQFLRKLGPNFQNTGLEIEPRFPAKPLRRKSSFATWPSPPVPAQPNPKSKIQTPNGPFGFWILDFGFRILDFGFWISDFGFWILDFGFWILDFGFWILDFGFRILDFGFWVLDQFSLRSFCGGPKRPRLDFGFWISDFGFWILDFGFWILDFGLGLGLLRSVWILHKIFPSHADSGRRIFVPIRGYWRDGSNFFNQVSQILGPKWWSEILDHECRKKLFCKKHPVKSF